ncbi:acyl-CoA dehydrogenase family protein [Rhodoligotrophos ferricapiens]|uniref:acyl-CoA dehydrogenase family protein n=1 Tax=Rhodoligotrophos ferricapiens TaxID=3069264 RepID=UPI00315D0C7D
MTIFGPEHEELRRSLRRFIDTEINPFVQEWEDIEQFPSHEICKKAGNAGFLGISKPVEFGGLGLDYSYSTIWAEALGTIHCGGIASALGVQTDMCTPALAKHGNDELRREFLAPTIAGDYVGCLGVSEVGAGSDVASIKTYARRDGDDYVINGGKMWTTNGTKADWICLLANTSDENGPHKNKSLIVVPMDAKGIDRSTKLRKFGLWASDTAQVFFDNVRVPRRNLIGEEGMGFIYQMEQFAEERLFAAARTVTQMQGLIDATIEYTGQRVAFGKPLLDNQWIHYTLSDMATEVEALRCLTYTAVENYVKGEDVKLLTAMAKLKAGKLAREIPDQCLQFWGGAGYLWESRVSRILRDSRLVAIGGGANEVMMAIISKELGILPGRNKRA